MRKAGTDAESLVHDLHNFYGIRADIFQAIEYLEQDSHPTPGGFMHWLEAKNDRKR